MYLNLFVEKRQEVIWILIALTLNLIAIKIRLFCQEEISLNSQNNFVHNFLCFLVPFRWTKISEEEQ